MKEDEKPLLLPFTSKMTVRHSNNFASSPRERGQEDSEREQKHMRKETTRGKRENSENSFSDMV